jgi:hypothetical protein
MSAALRPFDGPRSYLFVSARDPLAAAAAVWGWADGPPDLCVTSPSPDAHETAAFACAGHSVRILDEPMLARRAAGESVGDFDSRYAEALRIVLAFDTRAALVVCDLVPARWATPFFVDGESLRRRAELIEREAPFAP